MQAIRCDITFLTSRVAHIEVAASLYRLDRTSILCAVLSQEDNKLRGSVLTTELTSLVPTANLPDPYRNGTNLKFSQRCYRKRGRKLNPPAGSHHGGAWEKIFISIRKAMKIGS